MRLDDVLSYQNNVVVKHFCAHHPHFTQDEAQQIFADLLAWLWLREQRQKKNEKTYLFGPLLVLDDMWHCFILHTREYHHFCMSYFAQYLHHDPEPVGEEYCMSEEEITDFLADCFTYLDEAWVDRRFADVFK